METNILLSLRLKVHWTRLECQSLCGDLCFLPGAYDSDLGSFAFFRSFLCEQLKRLSSSAQGWGYGCETQVQKYPRHSEMCRRNVKWNVLMKSESCQGRRWCKPDFAPICGSTCKLGGAAAGENLVPLLQSAMRSVCPCLCFHQAWAVPALSPGAHD